MFPWFPAPRRLLPLALALQACASTPPLPPQAAELNKRGVEALARGDLEIADARFSLAVEYSPRFVDAWTNLGLVEMERGNFRRADQLLRRARRLNPDIPQPHHGLGVLEERQGRADRASTHYREALRVDPGFLASRMNLARLLFQAGWYEQARIEVRKGMEVGADDPNTWTGLAEILLRIGRVEESDQLTVDGLARFPDHPDLVILEARRVLRGGDVTRALGLLLPLSTRHDPVGVAALGWMATAELARGRPRDAVGAAKMALGLSPDDPVATHVLGQSLTALDDPDAPRWVERARKLRK
jgi:Flp pilus assembly protein TadD